MFLRARMMYAIAQLRGRRVFPGRDCYDVLLDCIDYYCIRPVLIPLLRRHAPYVNHCVCDWIDIIV